MRNIILFLSFFFISTTLYAQQETAKAREEKPVDVVSLSVSEIPVKADDTHQFLKKIRENIRPQETIINIDKSLKLISDSLEKIQADSLYKKFQSAYTRSLQNLRQEWLSYHERLSEWEKILQERTQEIEDYKNRVQKSYENWDNTANDLLTADVPVTIKERVRSIKIEIDSTRALLSDRINDLLVIQNKISKQKLKIEEIVAGMEKIIAEKRSHIFIVDQPPLWKAFSESEDTLSFTRHVSETWGTFWKSLQSFARTYKTELYIHLIILIALIILLYYFYRLNKQQSLFNEEDEVLRASAFFISRPFSAAFLISLFMSVLLYTDTTVTIGELLVAVILIPFQRLLNGAIRPERKKSVHILSLLYLTIFTLNNIIGYALLQRFFLLLITLITIYLFVELIRSVYPLHKQGLKPWPKLLFIAMPFSVFLLIISAAANIIGSFTLSLVLTEGIIKSVIIGVILYTTARVLDGLVILSIRKRITQALHFVQTYAEKLEHWTVIVIHFFAFFIWIRSILRAFRILQPVQEWIRGIMATKWEFGNFILSVQNIFDFFLILILSFALSRLIRIILDLELFPRIHLPRGIPGAISMIVRYSIVGVGIFLAISSLGVDLSTFGLLAGTLGVGIGFGLQNVIANFVSGLILTFERPIQVGDKIEVGNVLGNVKQIGVRSSTVKTFDGSEVIVPNADLISNQVINWTLTDTRQRMKLPVKVAFESDPDQVLEILLKVVKEHPSVLDDPEPVATFNGFGDYFLDFTLYYWITGNIFQTKTEVALGVHRAIKEAGIKKPKPQQEIQILVSEDLENVKISGGGKKKK